MKRIIVAFLLILNIGIAYGASDKTITSKTYVDNQLATKQDKIRAIDDKTVITHTGTSGDIGQKAIYDSNESYVSQQTSLMTAGDANTGINNALENEFVCVDEDTDGTCLLWNMSVARNSVLPTTYTQLEYIESTGTQYIDTDIVPTNSTGLKIKFNRFTNSDQVVVGVGQSTSSGEYYPGRLWVNWANGRYLAFGDTGYLGAATSNVDFEVSINYLNNREKYINGTKQGDVIQTLGSQTGNIYLFAGHNMNVNQARWFFVGKIYYLKITNGMSLVRNMIPVRRNSDGELGMYDTVSGQFFTNVGTGTFSAPEYLPQNQ